MTQERDMLSEKLTIKWIDFQFRVFEALEDHSKALNLFFSSPRKNNAII